ncbi:MAG: cysteine--tRNA ligase [Eubacteriales bacterium]|nr:cysteine--tRNA ligase [Eubacteriales bacterium]
MKIYNTLSKSKEEFIPIEEKKIRMYVCGPTVYDYIHIGNARPMIVFDTFRRYMTSKGYDVNYISNYTDIDDKIINKANETNTSSQDVALKYIEECKKDMKEMNILPQTYAPKATEEVEDMIELIKDLLDKKYAYKSEDGTVYFDTLAFKDYGKLSHKNIDELESGFREIQIKGIDDKKNPTDFVLWKPKKENEPYWKSPFCDGRPGWHTECCVMAPKYAKGRLDIHAGGEDLIFPHHENEIAQYEASHNEPFAKYWMHNAFLNINNTKMSKSLGNFFTVRDILNKFDGRVLRLFMLQAHYRSMLNFSFELMEQTKLSLDRIFNSIENIKYILKKTSESYNENDDTNQSSIYNFSDKEKDISNQIENYKKIFFEKMDDDLNTADAITCIYEIVRIINSNVDILSSRTFLIYAYSTLNSLCNILGIDVSKPLKTSFDDTNENFDDEQINKLIEERDNYKKQKDYINADKIRDELLKMHIEIKDTQLGTKWKRV